MSLAGDKMIFIASKLSVQKRLSLKIPNFKVLNSKSLHKKRPFMAMLAQLLRTWFQHQAKLRIQKTSLFLISKDENYLFSSDQTSTNQTGFGNSTKTRKKRPQQA
jgi:hypothetical protein